MEDLKELQQELDKQKWLEGEKTGRNMAGHMVYCQKCPCKDIYSGDCNATYQYALDNLQCAKMETARKEPVKLVITPRFQKTKKDKDFMKEVNQAYEEALSYALFDTTKYE